MKKVFAVILCLCIAAVAAACSKPKGPDADPISPVSLTESPKSSNDGNELALGDTYKTADGLSVTISSYEFGEFAGSLYISGQVTNDTDKDIDLPDAMNVSINADILCCEGAPREDFGITDGIGFRGIVPAKSTVDLHDVVLLPNGKDVTLTAKIVFTNGEKAVWALN